ncbi:Leucine Rich repeat/Leucine Rich Repeat [Leishmania donovani]|uniref:Leucine_Rich_repeat/Leucine_Rich_Repeat_-_putative n=3 Tax=Leishmania donovani species complex TaxID=38574 RepID=A0A6L0XFY4_LEIIN|nr:Leucine_Rich_repeat/Leucine_Rich_Repeat_-_putative [Leishmania infantum]CAJ1989754.1 Leucine Rich repeat/Leucine Rich Repeat [Leishmania donovani]SUZ42757.1 Leucine_Rich_repeat/Leucine_Rich_Repeat_-_putative [Leishmania infantum]VDZ45618.1 Leucine_Rich_repeat/Leucine_Rich_Repeat_putative/Pfam:PF13516/Pfam:PF00560 [Leishmania donovani]
MQSMQLTNDAGFKFELWKKLLTDALVKGRQGSDAGVQASVASALFRVALPTVQAHLPRRVREPCCLSGACTTPGIPFVHRCVHLGRRRIETMESCRDELCFCLAHSTTCAGPAVDLVVHGYYSTGNDMRDRYRGLRCLLHHTRARRICFENVDNSNDAREIVGELCYLMQNTSIRSRSWSELHLINCALNPVSFHTLATCLRTYDCLVNVAIENCHVGTLASVAAYVRSAARLTHLSLRGTTMATHWADVGEAVAASVSLVHLNISSCNWQDVPHLSEFVGSLAAFAPRPRFALDLSFNLLTSKCFALLTKASVAFRACVTDVFLGGHKFTDDEEDVSRFLGAYELLDTLSVRRSVLSTGTAQRVLRAVTDKKRLWRLVDVAHVNLANGFFKRICQATFAPGTSSLVCSGVDLHGQITKAGFAGCAPVLSRLDLSNCSLTDECVGQLASALERGAPLSLRHLGLSSNVVDKNRTKGGDGSFLFLCKALRSHSAPYLESLDLSGNKLPLLPVVALMEQASVTMRWVNFSNSSIADCSADRVRVLTTLMRRQRGAAPPFVALDVIMASSVDEPWVGLKEVTEWLTTQVSVRLITEAAVATASWAR